jgi:hypothetical protein
MRAEIKNLFSLEIDDLERFVPNEPDRFRVPIRLVAGPEGMEGEETFDFEVCSPRALEGDVIGDDVLLVRHKLLMNSFDFVRVRNFVESYVRGCEGATWNDVAGKLARLGQWEFEDYQE